MNNQSDSLMDFSVAIIGFSCRLPGAGNVRQYWENLLNGVESISYFSEEEVLARGVEPKLLKDPHYVRAGAVLQDVELFDAEFFGYFPREAEIMDPQHRIFLESAWEALEDAGYCGDSQTGLVSVYASSTMNTYLLANLLTNREMLEKAAGDLQMMIGNDKDFLSTRVSYKLDLKGPSYTLQTACSSSLVAIHVARQALLTGECDIALAGGTSVRLPQGKGYLYQPGGTSSPDGKCRAFDMRAEGSVVGSGVGVVVLKRLEDALADRDCIHAIIRGSAINNDGAAKVGFTAPSVEGQARVVSQALASAEIEADSIRYIECHGTATRMGDPIEVSALTKAYRRSTDKKSFCAVGSVKTNIGHLDAAAGIAGLIKAILCVKTGTIPASLNFETPNPEINFTDSPFYVNNKLSDWPDNAHPRRAGVNSIGIGGTNAHVIIEEPPAPPFSDTSGGYHLLTLSAQTETALEAMRSQMTEHLRRTPEINLADLAFTLHVGRRDFPYRESVVAGSVQEAVSLLTKQKTFSRAAGIATNIAFMFPGQGTWYVDAGRELYAELPVFRDEVDLCASLLLPHLQTDIRSVLFPHPSEREEAVKRLQETEFVQPALFTIEYALARQLIDWGIQPAALIGHSIGELVAACLSGIFTLQDAIFVVARRGLLMQTVGAGSMISVVESEDVLRPFLKGTLSLAAVNAPRICVISGATQEIKELSEQLSRREILFQNVPVSRAFHSRMMYEMAEAFSSEFNSVSTGQPLIPIISNLTGTWHDTGTAIGSEYWAQHVREPVRFGQGVATLLADETMILLEVGPGHALSSLALAQLPRDHKRLVLPTMSRSNRATQNESATLLTAIGELWKAGAQLNWETFHRDEKRCRIPLPTYPFERKRYWMDPAPLVPPATSAQGKETCSLRIPSWRRGQRYQNHVEQSRKKILVFAGEDDNSARIVQELAEHGHLVVQVKPSTHFERVGQSVWHIPPASERAYVSMLRAMKESDSWPHFILHLWSQAHAGKSEPESDIDALNLGLGSLLRLAGAVRGLDNDSKLRAIILTWNLQDVLGIESPLGKAQTVFALPHSMFELDDIEFRALDLDTNAPSKAINCILAEASISDGSRIAAWRGPHRWIATEEMLSRADGLGLNGQLQGVSLLSSSLNDSDFNLLLGFISLQSESLVVLERRCDLSTEKRSQRIAMLEKLGCSVIRAPRQDERQDSRAMILQEILRQPVGPANIISLLPFVDCTTGDGESLSSTILNALGAVREELVFLEQLQAQLKPRHCLLISPNSPHSSTLILARARALMLKDYCEQKEFEGEGNAQWRAIQLDVSVPQRACAAPTSGDNFSSTLNGLRELMPTLLSTDEPFYHVSLAHNDHASSQSVAFTPKQPGTSAPHLRPNIVTSYEQPRTELEKQVAAIWEEILGIEKVGATDDFFKLGGHSLLATQLISRLRREFEVNISMSVMLDNPTVSNLARAIEKLIEDDQISSENLAEVLSELEKLPPEEALALLGEQYAAGEGESE
jgi:acyl transferase domain-containing protein/acyl carrier protein